jgi:hypothetical protein
VYHIEEVEMENYEKSITMIMVILSAIATTGCSPKYDRFIGQDVRDVIKAMDDNEHMVVWPRDNSIIYKDCQKIDYVTIVPKYPPSHSIYVQTDGKCKVTSIEKRKRKGL